MGNTRQNVRVLLPEQNPLAASYLKSLLRRSSKFKHCKFERSGNTNGNPHPEPIVIIIDAAPSPAPMGPYLSLLRSSYPNGAMLLIGNTLNREDYCRILLMGVKGFIRIDEVERDLVLAVNSLCEGRMWVPAEILERFVLFVGEQTKPKFPNRAGFSEREKVVLGLLHRRLSNKEIGSAMGISDRTVKFHLEKIYDKIGVRDRHSVADLIKPSELVKMREKPSLRPAFARLSTKFA